MQTIINPYTAKVKALEGKNLVTELGVLTLDVNKDRAIVFQEGVTAAQQAPIVLKLGFDADQIEEGKFSHRAFFLGLAVEINDDKEEDEEQSCYLLEITEHGINSMVQVWDSDLERLKEIACQELSSLVTQELGHPVKFELC